MVLHVRELSLVHTERLHTCRQARVPKGVNLENPAGYPNWSDGFHQPEFYISKKGNYGRDK